ncbi:MAG: hypothetical protein OXC91_08655 [Rhodobacteraceae bacterium]|nr:hypothetical protein [Paracoccaceae bacterium]
MSPSRRRSQAHKAAHRIVVQPSPPRRWLAIGFLVLCGCLLGFTGLASLPTGGVYAVIQCLAALSAIWAAWCVHRATAHCIEFVGDELRCTDGTLIASIDDIQRVDISLFAFKPSNGMVLVLGKSMSTRWQPGLWWRVGRHVGIGGCTPKAQARQLAEEIEVRLLDS